MEWLSERMGENAEQRDDPDLGPLRVLYDIDGDVPVEEHELDHLRGYRDSGRSGSATPPSSSSSSTSTAS